ncbi:hypothetical protein CVT25_015526 [Psilocybe cyanescens]|uniref:INO80 complex subunit F domain-containing protein n=1 Tax=Psilocybe cyanescens TaxID=93625 RepID=A0A409WI63_PSICY|nr:hypothetical protein CVT25_015526 [Psilocybe cyanescens]
MSPLPSPAPQPPPSISLPVKHKQKPLTVGIAAGAEDAKYHAKYKELKRKVKDIESDNDKLHFKVLQAKLSIRRMKMERAVLYERLSVVPPSPNMQDRHPLPPTHPVAGGPAHQLSSRPLPGSHHHREMHDHLSSMDPDQTHISQEHIRSQGTLRLGHGPDGRSAPTMDNSAVALSPHMNVRSPRRISAHDSSRHHLPPMPQISSAHPHQYESGRGQSHSNSHASPPLHHAHPSSSHSRNRSHSSSHSRSQHVPPQSYRDGPGQHQHYPESLPSVHQPMHSPPPSERERPRRGEAHEYAGSHTDPHAYDRHQTHLPLSPRAHPSDARSSGRIHSHQRLGPGTYITRDEFQDKRSDLEREREWEREHEREHGRNRDYSRSREISSYQMHSPPHSVQRSRSQIDRADYDPHMPPRGREESAYYHDSQVSSGYPRLTRSDTPGSGSASGSGAGVADVPSRPDSRSQYYERDRARSYRLRPVSQPNEDIDFVHEDSRSQSRADGGAVGVGGGGGNFPMSEQSRPSLDSRKRTRHDMEVDSDNDVVDGPSGGGSLYSSGRLQEDRGSKRYHREHPRRSADTHEDSRMGPP